MSATRSRRLRLPDIRIALPRSVPSVRRRRGGRRIPRRVSPVLAGALVGLIVLAGGLWLWFRDSSFVSIQRVRIVGVSGPDVGQIDRALRNAALTMSTLDVNMAALQTAVRPYPEVKTLTVQTHFPHAAVIRVREQVPLATVSVDGRSIVVAGDGTLLQTGRGSVRHLPTIPLRVPPAGTRLNEPGARQALTVLAAAPYRLLGHILNATRTGPSGVVVQLRNGPQLRFGDTTQLHAKWEAAIAVLGNAGSHGAEYIDVSDPQRPAAGAQAGTGGSSGSSSSSSSSSSTGSSGSSGSTSSTSATSPTGSTSSTGTSGTPAGG